MGGTAVTERFVATILFADIVGSTDLAASMGDGAWSRILDAYYGVARRELKRFHGKEIDTAGDGLFAAFDAPAQALECAREIVEAMWKMGIAVRAGLHTGECERMGKKVGGLAVHIGARVASLAGPGDVVLTSTVRDLALGSGTRFEERGSHSLKGVPNQWQVFALEHADRAPLADRPILGETRRRSRLPALFAVGAVAIAVAVAVPLLTLRHHSTAPARAPVVKALVPSGIVRIDPSTNEPVEGVSFDGAHTVIVANGFVWAAGREGVAKIYPRTGKVVAIVRPKVGHSRPAYPCGLSGVNNSCSLTVGGGRIWLVNRQAGATEGAFATETTGGIFSIDPSTATPGPPRWLNDASAAVFAAGDLWVTSPSTGTVIRLDAATGRVKARIQAESQSGPGAIAAGEGSVWVVSGTAGGISRIDPATNLVTPIPVQQATSVAVGEGGVWITDQETGAVTEYSPDGSQLRHTIEVGGTPTAIAVGHGSVWVADVAHQAVVRLDPVSGAKVATVPIGWPPFGIAVGAGGVWVAGPDIQFNCC